ncbi:hypothetical protein [Kribbella sp. VKM Ac-2568]|uniref:hypothetical protein n=1 Tax=Kribbella sp. VKM Ac-2568 TaxID=2512219 RepID=UPI00104455A7|nr:hypothetical protein [Kribbella sp. VKM Ac-2568]
MHNFTDDGLIVAGVPGTRNARIYQNVITQCLTALSFSGNAVGQIYIFRNLFDSRLPTLGTRPGNDGPLRQGRFHKEGTAEGPFDLFHNTCIVLDAGGIGTALEDIAAAGFGHYRSLVGADRRRAYNNIFVAVFSKPNEAKAIAFLPPSGFAGPTDGNTYHRFGSGPAPNFRVPTAGSASKPHQELSDYILAESPQEQSRQSTDPLFKSFDETGTPQPGDDLRLESGSPAHDSAVTTSSHG